MFHYQRAERRDGDQECRALTARVVRFDHRLPSMLKCNTCLPPCSHFEWSLVGSLVLFRHSSSTGRHAREASNVHESSCPLNVVFFLWGNASFTNPFNHPEDTAAAFVEAGTKESEQTRPSARSSSARRHLGLRTPPSWIVTRSPFPPVIFICFNQHQLINSRSFSTSTSANRSSFVSTLSFF